MGISGVKLNKSKIIETIHKKKGVILHASLELGCDPSTLYPWIKKDEEVRAALEEARANADLERIDQNQILKEKAYKAANRLLDKHDCTMTIFTLKTLCGLKEQAVDQHIVLEHIDKPYRDQKNTNTTQV